MAFTPEQQAQIDLSIALDAPRIAHQEAARVAQTKLEMVRIAKDVLTENARSKPVDARGVTAEDILAFAQQLVAYVNAQ